MRCRGGRLGPGRRGRRAPLASALLGRRPGAPLRPRSSTRRPSLGSEAGLVERGVTGRKEHLGRAEDPVAIGAEGDTAPLARRRERRPRCRRPAGVVGVRRADGEHRGVRRLIGGSGQRGERPGARRRVRAPSRVTSSTTSMRSSVSVPVLSAHTTSTRARPSTAPSSCTRQPWRPRRTTPTAKAMLVRSTRPSGIMAMTPATVPLMASAVDSLSSSWVTARRIEIGMMANVTRRRTRLMSARIWEWTIVKRLASSASVAA